MCQCRRLCIPPLYGFIHKNIHRYYPWILSIDEPIKWGIDELLNWDDKPLKSGVDIPLKCGIFKPLKRVDKPLKSVDKHLIGPILMARGSCGAKV